MSAAAATADLDTSVPAIEGFRAVLADLATDIDANWQGTLARTDPEFLHDLRVATRRTRSVLANSKGVIPARVRDAARRGFGQLSDLTGRPRDLDVYLLGWSDHTDPLGADAIRDLGPVREMLERDRDRAYEGLIEAMRSDELRARREAWDSWLQRPIVGPLPARAREPLGKIVAKRISTAQVTLVRAGRAIDADSPSEALHDLRKDAKKLRYLLECFGPILGKEVRGKLVKRLKALQENLGQHQDAAVHLEELRTIARALHDTSSVDTMLAIGQLMGELAHVQRVARNEFSERFAAYDTPATTRAIDAAVAHLNR